MENITIIGAGIAGLCAAICLAEKGIANVREIIGAALNTVSETTDVLERDTVLYPRFDREKCIGCGRCILSCEDGGHQALKAGKGAKPVLDVRKCVGCHLCVLVCPEGAVRPAGKRRKL